LQGLAQSLGGREPIAIAAWRHCNFLERTGDYAGVLPAAREAMRLAEEAQSTDLRLRAQTRAAMALYRIGETRAGTLLAEEGLEAARHEGLREIEGLFLNALSAMASLRVDPVACLNYDEAHLRIVRELGDTLDSTYALLNVGNDLTGLGQHDRAGECLAEGLRQTYALGNRMGQANALFNLSILALREGDAALAQAHARAALDISIATRYPEGEFWACLCLSNAELALGQLDEAATRFERARALSQASGNHWLLDALTGLARVALARTRRLMVVEPLAQVAQKGELNGRSPFLVLTCHRPALYRRRPLRHLLELASRPGRVPPTSATRTCASYLNRIPKPRDGGLGCASAGRAHRAPGTTRHRATALERDLVGCVGVLAGFGRPKARMWRHAGRWTDPSSTEKAIDHPCR
jgi:tetratricopeptide (TPR) repeat protein